MGEKLSVTIFLPTRCSRNTSDHILQVSEDGNSLKVSFEWPLAMRVPDVMLHTMLNHDNPEVRIESVDRSVGFRPYLRSFRANTNEPIVSACNIALPVTVNTASATRPVVVKFLRIPKSSEKLYLSLSMHRLQTAKFRSLLQ